MNGPIVVGFDGSPESLAASRWAAAEAKLRGLPLELLQAWPWRAPHVLGTPDAVDWGRAQLARREVELNALMDGVEVTALHLPDAPADALVTAAKQATMLVLGSRGLGALRGFLVGSVSQEVLARVTRPTVLVRAQDEDDPPPTREVVLGLNLRHRCAEVLDFGFEAAQLHGVPLRVVHVWRPLAGSEYLGFAAVPALDRELAATEQQQFAEALAPWRERFPTVAVSTELVPGSPAAALLETVGRPALLVVGRRERHRPLGPHLGPVTHAAIHHAHSPVAVVPYS